MAWLTVQEAADILRVPVSWLYERTRTNSVPHVKLGKYLRFDRDELVAWINELIRDGRLIAAGPRPSRISSLIQATSSSRSNRRYFPSFTWGTLFVRVRS